MSKQEYTVFSVDDAGEHCFRHVQVDSPQGAADEYARIGSYTPVAWVEGRFTGNMADTQRGALAAIAAGRLIEKTASGWVALGAEKQESLIEQLWTDSVINKGLIVSRTPTLDKLERELREGKPTSADLAMIARDGAAKPKTYAPFTPFGTFSDAPVSLAKPNPFPTTLRSPDCDSGPSDHLNASRHQVAGMSKS